MGSSAECSDPQLDQITVLVVGGASGDVAAITLHLRSQRVRVLSAEDAAQAMRKARSTRPDLVLVASRLPDSTGLELLERLRTEESTADVPVVLIAGSARAEDRIKAFKAGAVDCVSKPMRQEEVCARITTHASLSRIRRQLEARNEQLQQEVAERVRAEKPPVAEEAYLKALFDNVPIEIYGLDDTLRYTIQNAVSIANYGSVVGKSVDELGLPEEIAEMWRIQDERVLGGEVLRGEYEREIGGDKTFWENVLAPVVADGRAIGVVGVGIDVTERRLAQEALRDAAEELERGVAERTAELVHLTQQLSSEVEQRRRAEEELLVAEQEKALILNSSSELVVYHTPDLRVIWANKTAGETVGQEPQQLEGRYCYEIWHDRSKPCSRCPVVVARDSGMPHEAQIASADGREWYIRAYPVMSGNGQAIAMVEFCLEVTERVRVETALREGERRYRGLFEDSPVSLLEEDFSAVKARLDELRLAGVRGWRSYFVHHPEELTNCARLVRVLDVNQATLKLLGANSKEELTAGLPLLLTEQSMHVFREQLVTMANGGRRLESEAVLKTLTGQEINVVVQVTVPPGFEDTLGKVLVSLLDVTESKRAQERLRESEAKYRRIVDTSDEGIWVLGEPLVTEFVNARMAEMLGYTPEEMVGRIPTDFMPDEDASDHEDRMRARRKGRSERYERRFRRKDGTILWTSASATPILDGGGRLVGSFAMFTDITADKEAEFALRESEERYHRLVDASPDAIVVYQQGTVMFVNPAAVSLFGGPGASPADLVGRPVATFVHPDSREIVGQRMAQMGRDRTPLPPIEEKYLRLDGAVLTLELAAIPCEWRGEPAAQVVARDITGRKQAEETQRRLNLELAALNAELEERVGERTAELEMVNRELEAFCYSVSHDLRAPLRHIDGFVELLQGRIAGTLDSKSAHYLATISSSAVRMAQLIDSLLAFSRLGRQEVTRQQVDLGQLVQEIIQDCTPEIQGRNVSWRVGTLPCVWGDRTMLRTAFANLIANAVKFTQPRKQAIIEIGARADSTEEVVLFVKDNGIGFDMEYSHRLFEVFQRLHSPDQFEGTGVGLANVRRVVSRHGGRTWAEAEKDRGATFFLSLPVTNGDRGKHG